LRNSRASFFGENIEKCERKTITLQIVHHNIGHHEASCNHHIGFTGSITLCFCKEAGTSCGYIQV
jgi:hypothetical protein